MIINKLPIWRRTSVIVAALVVVLAGLFFSIRYFGKSLSLSFGNQKKIDYVITGVPYIGNYNHVGDYGHLDNRISETLSSVADYWYPGKNNYAGISSYFDKISATKPFIGAHDINDFFAKAKNGKYNVSIEHLQLGDLKRYINPDVRTPLLVFLAIDAEQSVENLYNPLVIVIGIKESEQKLILHDTWMGNNFEISFDDFNRRMEQMRPEWRNNYVVVQPADLKNKLKEIQSRNVAAYPARTETMEKAQSIFRNYALGWGAEQSGQYDSAIGSFLKAKNDPGYDKYFPLAFKVFLTADIADTYLQKKDFSNASAYAAESVSLDHDLDKPAGDWPGYEVGVNASGHFGESTIPYRVQGDIYMATKDFEKAENSYAKAIEIKPINSLAKAGLAAAEAALAKK